MGAFLATRGNYRDLRVFGLAEAICDLTVKFVAKFISAKSRTRDQMEQAARSGKQNIAEGSKASMTSRETEIKLTNVAKASLEELKLDYEDYLRQHSLELWEKSHPRTLRLRFYLQSEHFRSNPVALVDRLSAEEYCNMCITLICQATYMLDKLLIKQQEQFLVEGGIREQMTRARLQSRNRQWNQPNQTYRTNPKLNATDKSDKSDKPD